MSRITENGGLLALLSQHPCVPEEILVMLRGIVAAVVAASFGTSRPVVIQMGRVLVPSVPLPLVSDLADHYCTLRSVLW